MPRLRKSVQEHLLAGTEPQWQDSAAPFAGGRPRMPKYLDVDEQEAWKAIVKLLAKRGTLSPGDGPSIEIYANSYARHRALLKELREHGEMVDVTVLDSSGNAHTKRVANPAGKLATQLANSLRAMLKEFGGTPASREKAKRAGPAPQKVKLAPGDDPDPIMP